MHIFIGINIVQLTLNATVAAKTAALVALNIGS